MPRSSSSDGGDVTLDQTSAGPALPAAFGRYKVLRLLGEGAMGRVLLAHDPVLDRDVALKHLRDDLRVPRETREGLLVRMRHEARAAARVMHPNLVTLHDMGEDPELGIYLVFEYVEGPTLKQRIHEGALPAAQAARLARELGEALTLAHRAGIVHRDVKPENIILSSTGGKVADFGIARIPDSTLTHQGGLMGTPAYSAPETFRAGKFSPESDQFSLAAVMYEAICSERAFPGDDAVSVAARIAHDEPLPIAATLGLSPSLDQVLARGLSKKPEERFASCELFGAAFAASVEDAARTLQPTDQVPTNMMAATPHARSVRSRRASRTDADLPRERRTGQVILGAAVVVATAALLARTALRSEEVALDAPVPSTSAPTSAAIPPRPRLAPPARPARPKPEPSEIVAPAGSSAAALPDAGPPLPSDAPNRPAASSQPKPEIDPPAPSAGGADADATDADPQ